MSSTSRPLKRTLERYPSALATIERLITGEAYFEIFKQLSDNYSPSLTVTRVQGPLVDTIIKQGAGEQRCISVDRSLHHSGSIAVKVGDARPALWLSAHADICSYLTSGWDGSGYPLTPFCMHRVTPGRRAAVALAAPEGEGPLERLAMGEMVTLESGEVRFECDRADLPLCTRVVHHLPAAWDRASDRMVGFIDNQAGSAAMLLAAQALSHFDASALFLLNDEEEGPVGPGGQGFSRAANRLLHRTPLDELPNYVVVTDGHGQEEALKRGTATLFGKGAAFTGVTSQARGGITPPQILAYTRAFAEALAPHGINLLDHDGYVGRSDDISALQFTPNVSIIGYPGAYAHFEKTPFSHVGDLVQLTKVLTLLALVAQDSEWQARYL
ncbi:MAG: hypothetical protein ACJ8CR_29730 [Roseiflexaceae bacterium]